MRVRRGLTARGAAAGPARNTGKGRPNGLKMSLFHDVGRKEKRAAPVTRKTPRRASMKALTAVGDEAPYITFFEHKILLM
jgi:hypothetical protein